jgi:hypothetical protein
MEENKNKKAMQCYIRGDTKSALYYILGDTDHILMSPNFILFCFYVIEGDTFRGISVKCWRISTHVNGNTNYMVGTRGECGEQKTQLS